MHAKPIPISLNISLYSCSTDLVLEPTSPFFIFVICLSSRVVSKNVIANIATLKPVIDIWAARIVKPFEAIIRLEIIKKVISRPANTCLDDPRTSLHIKYARRAINVVVVNDTVFLFCILYILTLSNLPRLP